MVGNALRILPALGAGSAQCVVTSPPYWGLRDYGIEPSVWGGDPGCAAWLGCFGLEPTPDLYIEHAVMT